MKIAVSGKGGVGKTTLTALLAYALKEKGFQVMAVDADPAPCLGAALGFPEELLRDLRPIAEMEELIAERTGAQPGSYGVFFRLNPRVEDLPDRFSVTYRGIRLLELGGVEQGGSGCICPESALLKALITHLLLHREEVVLLDMYAGVEHLGRATADSVDAMLIVAEPTVRSLVTAHRIRELATEIGIERLYLVGNKVETEEDRALIEAHAASLPLLGLIPQDPAVREADRTRRPAFELSEKLARVARDLRDRLLAELQVAALST